MTEYRFKNIVKIQCAKAATKYLNTQQTLKKHKSNTHIKKGSKIIYNNLALQDYLRPNSNLNIDEQREIFSFRCEMNLIKSNFSRMKNLIQERCITQCMKQIDNTHMTYCQILNSDSDY